MQQRHLESFVAVAEELHFGRAAERLFVAQSSVSAHVSALEGDLRARLFDRTSRHVSLTSAGEVLLGHARRLLADTEEAARDVRRASRGEVGVVHLAFVDSAAYALLPAVLPALRARVPDVVVRLREVSVETDLDQLPAAVDVAILRDVRAVEGMTPRLRVVERLVAAVPVHHPLAERERLRVADLEEVDLVLPHGGLAPNVHNHLRQVCAAAGVTPRVSQVALQYPTMVGLVAAGFGVALVPEPITMLARPDVVYLEVADVAATTTLVVLSSDRRDTPIVERFVDLAGSVVGTTPEGVDDEPGRTGGST